MQAMEFPPRTGVKAIQPINHMHLALTVIRLTFSLLSAFSNDAMFTAPFQALLCYQRRLTLVGTEDISTSDSPYGLFSV